MKSWRLNEPNSVTLQEMEAQPIGELCVKVKILYCSISHTDRLLAHGKIAVPYPRVLGKQAVGMVVETGSEVTSVIRGDIVAVKPLSVCGTCAGCTGKNTDCENPLIYGMSEDGMLRDFAVMSVNDIVKLPERISPRDAVFLDYIDIAIQTVSSLKIDKGQYLVIAGATQLGIILAEVAIYYQVIPILVDIDEIFLELAASKGVYYTINSQQSDTKKKIFALTGGKMADALAYMAESPYPFAPVMDYVKDKGGIAICGLKKSRTDLSNQFTQILNRQLSVYGISESNNNIASAINMLANKTVNVEGLVEKEIGFDECGDELLKELDAESGYLKTLVKM